MACKFINNSNYKSWFFPYCPPTVTNDCNIILNFTTMALKIDATYKTFPIYNSKQYEFGFFEVIKYNIIRNLLNLWEEERIIRLTSIYNNKLYISKFVLILWSVTITTLCFNSKEKAIFTNVFKINILQNLPSI